MVMVYSSGCLASAHPHHGALYRCSSRCCHIRDLRIQPTKDLLVRLFRHHRHSLCKTTTGPESWLGIRIRDQGIARGAPEGITRTRSICRPTPRDPSGSREGQRRRVEALCLLLIALLVVALVRGRGCGVVLAVDALSVTCSEKKN